MSQAITTSRELRNKDTRININVPDFHEVSGLLSNDEVFHVIVISSLPYFKTIKHKKNDTVQFMVEKRYSDFESLHKTLSDRFPATVFPDLPHKILMLKDSTPQERRLSFNQFMKFVAANPKVATCYILLAFLGIKQEKINQVEQMALDEAEAAKSEIIKTDEDGEKEKQTKSQQNKKKSVGLFDEIDGSDDFDLFQEKSNKDEELIKEIIKEEDVLSKGQETDSSLFSNERVSRREQSPSLFETAEDDTNDIYIPPGAGEFLIATNEGILEAKEDYSDLLKIDENLDQLLLDPKKSTKPPPPITTPKPKVTTPKPNTAPKPKTAPKPVVTSPKPKLAPKPGKASTTVPESAASSKETDVTDSRNGVKPVTDALGDEDILKYIQDNETMEEPTLDLF